MTHPGADNLAVFFLAEGEQTAASVMEKIVSFIRPARKTLDFAFYDVRLSGELKEQFTHALKERAAQGVQIRICVDGDKPSTPNLAGGQDPAPPGAGGFVETLGFPWRRIAGMKLMHHKFIVRDSGSVWTGSLNLTGDALSLMDNNVLQIDSLALAAYYAEDFDQLWEKENFENTGKIKTSPVPLVYSGQPASVRVMFAPGFGLAIDEEVARRVRNARRRVRICSLLINSGTLIAALRDLLEAGSVQVDGLYDRTQMLQVFRQWEEVPQNRWKTPALQDVIARAPLLGKNSTPYSASGHHDYMHNKILLVDDTVITGSYNFSRSAQFNAENILFIESAPLAERYSVYIDHLIHKYRAVT